MIGVSVAIIALILVLAFMFVRSGKRAGALFALPLISVSAFHLIGWAIYKLLVKSELPTAALHITIDSVGLAVGLILCWVLARAIDLKPMRYVYFTCCAVFLTAMLYAYIGALL